jgi:Flp pilus assembly protein TadG
MKKSPIDGNRGARAARGTAAIEFAIAIPMLLILLTGLVDVGLAAYDAMQVQYAAEAGGFYVSRHGWDPGSSPGLIAAAVVNSSKVKGIQVPAATQFCGCPGAGGIATTACPPSTATCADGSTPSQYVQVNATLPYSAILPAPWLPLPASFSGQSIVRVQ